MAKRSKVLGLPAEVKAWLDQALVENNFSQFELLAAELKKTGHEISKSAVHRYAQPFQDRLAALKTATEQARAVTEASPDDDNAMNDALIRLVQEKVFSVLVATSVGGEQGLTVKQLGQVTKAIADVGRASVQQKKFQGEVRDKFKAKLDKMASDANKKTGKEKAGYMEALKRVREEAYGLFEK